MSKVKNITPEERENALALIRKLGLEETEQQINYYVKMQRDSKNHREEKEGRTKNDSSSSIGKIFGLGIIIALFFMIKMCGGCNGCDSSDDSSSDSYEQSSSSSESEKAPSWIQGTWTCITPYGNMQVEIVGDHIREIPGDGSSYYGTYHIQGDDIMTESGSGMHYRMDKSSKRLEAGQGYYFEKQ